ncbi:MAG: hypothetical protein RR975_09875, partial [Clostridia bacterium]
MPAQLKEILKQTIPYHQQGAPLLLAAHAVYEDSATGRLIAQLKWRNISRQTVQAVNVTLQCRDSFGAALEASTYQYMDVSAAPQGIFGTQNAIELSSIRTRACGVSITAVSFADGSIWYATGDDTCVALPAGKSQTLSGDLLSQFKRDAAGRGFGNAALFTPQTYGDLWQCGCGCWQKREDEACASCKATMAELTALREPDALTERLTAYQQKQEEARIAKEKADTEARIAKEKADAEAQAKRKQLEKEAEVARQAAEAARQAAAKAKKRNIIIAVVLVVLVAAVLVFTQVIQPKQRYDVAVALMESGQYEEASAAFAKAGDYGDAAERVSKIHYAQAEALLASGEYEAAVAAFAKAGEYGDAAGCVKETCYAQA